MPPGRSLIVFRTSTGSANTIIEVGRWRSWRWVGRAADVWNYPVSYIFTAAIQALAIPFLWLAYADQAGADMIRGATVKDESAVAD